MTDGDTHSKMWLSREVVEAHAEAVIPEMRTTDRMIILEVPPVMAIPTNGEELIRDFGMPLPARIPARQATPVIGGGME